MHSAVTVRGTEIETLRALGFSGTSVVVSVLIDAYLLACIGALFGSSAGDGHVIRSGTG